jgi:hypothetical protein
VPRAIADVGDGHAGVGIVPGKIIIVPIVEQAIVTGTKMKPIYRVNLGAPPRVELPRLRNATALELEQDCVRTSASRQASGRRTGPDRSSAAIDAARVCLLLQMAEDRRRLGYTASNTAIRTDPRAPFTSCSRSPSCICRLQTYTRDRICRRLN